MSVDLPALRRIALAFPGVEEGTAYGTPCFRVRKKFIGRTRDGDSVYVLPMGIDERDMLIEAEPETFFVTDHYRAWPYVLVRLGSIDAERLRVYFERAWRAAAGKKLLAAYDGDKPLGSG
jgi:hypothetical protein